ncbi:unnamed protein product [Cuscuta campestris]|uniref:Uncharacterized protein n=1 Tax=Cuscuta campestris TaxID=132261 RepID=A0A484LRY6_9ASTE|nr:unnamed protein product [Cuscuta campestris]
MRGETFSFGSYSLGGSSAILTKSGPSSTLPSSPRDSWDSNSKSESVHPDPSAKIPGFIYYSSKEDEKTKSPQAPRAPPARREVVAPLVPASRGGRGHCPPAPPTAVPSESSVASHHPSRCSLEDPGSPSYDESTGHSVVRLPRTKVRSLSGLSIRTWSALGSSPEGKCRAQMFDLHPGKNVRVWSVLGSSPEEECRARRLDLYPGRTSGHGLYSALPLRGSAEHKCSTSIQERTSGYGLRSALPLRGSAEHEGWTFIQEEHPDVVRARIFP